ncbi:hemolysin XhlA family protein [Bacillus safensis]|nr:MULTISPECIES: hemolysin XhlA family protein [Bacillus]WCL58178.1 hemolysin XhlA family protein [Bacillus safensis]
MKTTADRAGEKSDKAFAKENRADIADMKANRKWIWIVMIGVVSVAISGVALFYNRINVIRP